MNNSGYKRFPTINGDKVVFVSEDDLWEVPAEGGVARRLTSNSGEVTGPHFSPDGEHIAFSGKEEGEMDVYVIPAEGGANRRLTFMGKNTKVIGWTPDSMYVLFSSNSTQAFEKKSELYKVSINGGQPEKLGYGVANNIAFGPKGGILLGRNTLDPAKWKRYKGGTAGVFWIDRRGNGKFEKFLDKIRGNFASPMWIGDRIFFISDHEGLGRLYSCNVDGKNIKSHSANKEYYVRNASTDGRKIVYHAGAELFVYDTETGEERMIDVKYYSPQIQRQRKFVDSGKYLEEYAINPDGKSVSITSRGKSYVFSNWEGPVMQLGKTHGVRYRLTNWLHDGKRLVTVSDDGGREAIEVHSFKDGQKTVKKIDFELGIAEQIVVSPKENKIAISNNRQELYIINIDKNSLTKVDRSSYERIMEFNFSPDGKWLVYSKSNAEYLSSLYLYNIDKKEITRITPEGYRDFQPSFDPEGNFIYFLSQRDFNPVYDVSYFQLGFPLGYKLYLVSLDKETPSPFTPEYAKIFSEKQEMKTKGTKSQEKKMKVDLDGIEERIAAFPLPEGHYMEVKGIRHGVLYSKRPLKGALDREPWDFAPDGIIEKFDFMTQRSEQVAKEVTNYKISAKGKELLYRSGNKLYLKPMMGDISDMMEELGKAADSKEEKLPHREKSDWIDLKRVKVNIDPMSEWHQMYSEAWRLQKEHFWTPDMSGIDWNAIYKRYLPLLDKVATRTEFSDLIWEMQGELGTSHAYEMGGDYKTAPNYKLGSFAAEYEYDPSTRSYRITHIVKGDSWKNDSPFRSLGIDIKEGDHIHAINGEALNSEISPNALLVNQANNFVSVTVSSNGKDNKRTYSVKTVASDTAARYREWVEDRKEYVHKKSKGKLGYVHIPDMMGYGFSEFHRYHLYEVSKPGLIVDLRNNRGGHVSQLLLEKLSRKRFGFGVSRWGSVESYPSHSVAGSIVAVTNEYAGSDGDIFSHNFKQMKLGPLVGKRTWGGVVGINPRHALADGTVTTQPEYATYMNDVGFKVENYGTDPDFEIDITPQEYAKGKDPQLDKAIEIALEQLKKKPVELPDFTNRPKLPLPVFEMATNGNGSHKKAVKS